MLELTRRTLLRHGLLFMATYLVLSGAFIVYGQAIANGIAPALAVGLDLVQSDFDTQQIVAEEKKLAVTAEMAVDGIAGKAAGGRAITMRTSRAILAISPVLALALVVAFPQRSKRAKLASLLIALPLIIGVMSLQVSTVLRSALTAQLLRKPPAFTTFMMENGGLQLLALVTALTALWLGSLLVARVSARALPEADVATAPSETPPVEAVSVAQKPARTKPLKAARGRAR